MSTPMASACRSTDLAVTLMPASTTVSSTAERQSVVVKSGSLWEMTGVGADKPGRLEDVYRKVRQAIETRRPISAFYEEHPRLFCPHRLGRNKEGELRVLCCQFGGASRSGLKPPGSPDNWRCIAVNEADYFERNADRMRYPVFRARLIRRIRRHRSRLQNSDRHPLKCSGMFWTVRGANAIIALRCCRISRRFEDYWVNRSPAA